MLKLNHKNLEVWKVSMKVIHSIYSLTENFPKKEVFGISNQLRRASISVASNIAEGSSRKSVLERRRFYEIARSSAVEIDTQIEIAVMLKYTDNIDLLNFKEDFISLFKMLSALIKSTV
ncbi:MAG TPA: four helix bundle protein [Ignavibacteria bacterium]|nr:four helix bundle protein [Ignavibacteria bacterium]